MDEFLDSVFLNNSVKQWIISAACILGGLIAGKACSLIMKAVHKHIAGKTKSDLDDIIIAVLARPLGLIVFLTGRGPLPLPIWWIAKRKRTSGCWRS